MTRKWALQTRYTLRRNTASIMKGLVWHNLKNIKRFYSKFQTNIKEPEHPKIFETDFKRVGLLEVFRVLNCAFLLFD